MAATDARPVPRKNVAYRFYFAIRKNDGTLITTWAGADSERSIDGAAFADCTNEATEIGTTGVGYIDLTAAEMNGDAVVYKLTVTNTDALPLVVTFFPEEVGDYRADVQQFGGTNGTFSAGRPEVNTSHAAGTAWNSGAIGAATLAADTITAAKIAADAIGASELATDAVAEIADAIWDEATAGHTTAGTFGEQVKTDIDTVATGVAAIEVDTQDIQSRLPAALVGGRIDATVDNIGMEAGAIDAILDDTIGDGTLTMRQVLRILVAGMAGKLSGAATTTVTIRNTADTADVIVATVDANGNRSAVTVTP